MIQTWILSRYNEDGTSHRYEIRTCESDETDWADKRLYIDADDLLSLFDKLDSDFYQNQDYDFDVANWEIDQAVTEVIASIKTAWSEGIKLVEDLYLINRDFTLDRG